MGVTALVNQKGGVGKTTVALGLASALGAAGRSVLVVDLDPQANATTGLGVWETDVTIDAVLAEDRPGAAARAAVPSGWSADDIAVPPSVLASSPNLAQVEHQLISDVIGAQDRLAGALAGVPDDYDEVLIDCPPSLGLLTVNALFAADAVAVVTEPAAWSSDGVDQILRNTERISDRRNGRPTIAGIVLNRVGRTRDAAHWVTQMVDAHPGKVLEPHVRLRAVLAEAAAQAVPVHSLSRSGAQEATSELDALAAVLFTAAPRAGWGSGSGSGSGSAPLATGHLEAVATSSSFDPAPPDIDGPSQETPAVADRSDGHGPPPAHLVSESLSPGFA